MIWKEGKKVERKEVGDIEHQRVSPEGSQVPQSPANANRLGGSLSFFFLPASKL
jgi:hypothetical protein